MLVFPPATSPFEVFSQRPLATRALALGVVVVGAVFALTACQPKSDAGGAGSAAADPLDAFLADYRVTLESPGLSFLYLGDGNDWEKALFRDAIPEASRDVVILVDPRAPPVGPGKLLGDRVMVADLREAPRGPIRFSVVDKMTALAQARARRIAALNADTHGMIRGMERDARDETSANREMEKTRRAQEERDEAERNKLCADLARATSRDDAATLATVRRELEARGWRCPQPK